MPAFISTQPVRIIQQSIESDEETWEEDIEEENKLKIHQQVEKKFKDLQDDANKYLESKKSDCDRVKNKWVKYLETEVFCILVDIMEKMLMKAKETNSLYYHKTLFSPLDFIAEQLWNRNPKHPNRHDKWVNIFDMPWAKAHLRQHPRPYFPFSWLWSKEYAAIKIQAFMRGHWVRRRDDVQEMRKFWRALEDNKSEAREKAMTIPPWCKCKEKMEDTKCLPLSQR